ncbi:MAG: hypothetical protein ACOYM4_18220 [Nodosilinea sp.]|jgi:hypothetical protein
MMNLKLAALMTLGLGAIAAPAALAQQAPDYYVGAGLRAGFNDNTSFVLDSKAKIADLGSTVTLSVRPALVFDSSTELRLPLSVDVAVTQSLSPYAGAGVAYNAGGTSTVDPMITGGLDWSVAQHIVIDLNANVLFTSGNTDTEFTATVNYAF